MNPTKKQRLLLDYVIKFTKKNGYSPSYRELKDGLGYTSIATVALHVDGLIERGYLRKKFNSARSLEVIDDIDIKIKAALKSEDQDIKKALKLLGLSGTN